MLIRCLPDCEEFHAGDDSLLRELLHPDKMEFQGRYSLAHALVRPGQRTRPHRLRTTEVYYILAGRGRMHIGAEVADVTGPCAIYIPPESLQYVENTGTDDLAFLCIVDPAWRRDDEEVLGD
jgi:mannose-6-phosphate isomerase-like protein (cupin superfamily)